MANYCTVNDMESWIGEKTLAHLTTEDLETEPTEYDSYVVLDAVTQASSLMDTHLCAQFTVPVDVVTDHPELAGVLKMHCIAIAAWQLYGLKKGEAIPDRVDKLHTQATDWLDKITTGEISLPNQDSTDCSGSIGTVPIYRGDDTYDPDET